MSDYTKFEKNGQQCMCVSPTDLTFPCFLDGFIQESNTVFEDNAGMTHMVFKGKLAAHDTDSICPVCAHRMTVHDHTKTTLSHIPMGSVLTAIEVSYTVYYCPHCHSHHRKSHYNQPIPFKANGHRVTKELLYHVQKLLSMCTLTLKDIAAITGLSQNTVRNIDSERLKALYTEDGKGKKLKRPTRQAKYIGIDEFLLHEGHHYATHVTDLETGEVLWIEESKKKDVVYHFIDHVGIAWMMGVEAVACDMNAHFAAAFLERCPWIQIVYDFFHIVKNLGDKLINPVRRDELSRLMSEGKEEEARSLVGSRYILLAARETLQKWDAPHDDRKHSNKRSLFHQHRMSRKKRGFEAWYDRILRENQLLFTVDIIKEELRMAYRMTNRQQMAIEIAHIINLCVSTENIHFEWFAQFLKSHIKGILSHTEHPISTGRIEGINNRIKTLRRQGYGYQNTEYFFLKIIDISNHVSTRFPPTPENWY